jgi:outer membrane lipoprotein LolB
VTHRRPQRPPAGRAVHPPRIATARAATLAAVLLLLAACATQPPEPVAPPLPGEEMPSAAQRWDAHRRAVLALENWEARGKVAYRLTVPEAGDATSEAGSASLRWLHDADGSRVRLAGPLGAGATTITRDGPLLKVRRDGIERRYPPDAAPWLPGGALLPIPVEALEHWLRGVPAPDTPVEVLELGADGRALRIEQDGWSIRYDAYAFGEGQGEGEGESNGAGEGESGRLPALPKRLEVTAPRGVLILKVLLRDWAVSARSASPMSMQP